MRLKSEPKSRFFGTILVADLGMFGFDRVLDQSVACRSAQAFVKMGKTIFGTRQMPLAA
jgi:hypothetical protein